MQLTDHEGLELQCVCFSRAVSSPRTASKIRIVWLSSGSRSWWLLPQAVCSCGIAEFGLKMLVENQTEIWEVLHCRSEAMTTKQVRKTLKIGNTEYWEK